MNIINYRLTDVQKISGVMVRVADSYVSNLVLNLGQVSFYKYYFVKFT